ncbi:unnamed protein product [Trypanosoma congolense IL3000]|uniref:WGS project CAEQ00000000 data, annotated contig 832 n=1 Tax=Trypanosoma congolense (strain IL3000) TaxID=1068625 RepID=F9WIT8_TRYCI|nr:unnamed protein product [Trypanosoma congolense IL3000]
MRSRRIKRGCTIMREYCHRSAPLKNTPEFRAIGLVHKIFVQRGYGFALMIPPPVSLLQSRNRCDANEESDSTEGLGDKKHPVSLSEECVSVWFPFLPCEAKHEGVGDDRAMPLGGCRVSPGNYVKFTAVGYYNQDTADYIWRARDVAPCDPREELRVALERVRNSRWDEITLEDVQKAKCRAVGRCSAPPGNLLGRIKHGTMREASDSSSPNGGDTFGQYIVRESDLRRPLSWMRDEMKKH